MGAHEARPWAYAMDEGGDLLTRGMGALAAREESTKLHGEYLRRIDVEAVLDHYGADNVHRKGDEIIHSCLLDRVDPHHAHGDSNPSASMNIESKLYNCYGYGGGDVLWFMTKMEGKEHFHQIVPMLSDFLTGSTVDTESFLKELERYLDRETVAESLTFYHERVLDRWALYHPYLRDRGVTKEAARQLQLGYDEQHCRITIPHWVNGKLVGWQRRSLSDPRWPQTQVERNRSGDELDGGRIPKYKNSPNFPKDSTIYNLDYVRERHTDVVVVESPMSVAKAVSLGVQNVVSTFGAKVGDEQIAALRGFASVSVWFDADSAGQNGAYKLMNGLYRHTSVSAVEPEQGKDMADYDTIDEIQGMLRKQEPAVLALARLEKRYGKR